MCVLEREGEKERERERKKERGREKGKKEKEEKGESETNKNETAPVLISLLQKVNFVPAGKSTSLSCSWCCSIPVTLSANDVTRGNTTFATFHNLKVSAIHLVSSLNLGKSSNLSSLLSRATSAKMALASERTRSCSGRSRASCLLMYGSIVIAPVSMD